MDFPYALALVSEIDSLTYSNELLSQNAETRILSRMRASENGADLYRTEALKVASVDVFKFQKCGFYPILLPHIFGASKHSSNPLPAET